MTSTKSAKRLIESRLKEMSMDGEVEYNYTCMDTGMTFETYDEPATYSPFTGSTNIEMMENGEDEFEPDYEDPMDASLDVDYDDSFDGYPYESKGPKKNPSKLKS